MAFKIPPTVERRVNRIPPYKPLLPDFVRGLIVGALILVAVFIIGSVGSSDFEEAKRLEVTVCAQLPRPDWCERRER